MSEQKTTALNRRKYKSVAANTTEADVYTPPDGSQLLVNMFGGDAAIDSEVKITIAFDDEIFFATHGVDQHNMPLAFTGDGTKQIVISLVNDSSTSETIGGYWSGYIVE